MSEAEAGSVPPPSKKQRANGSFVHEEFIRVYEIRNGKRVLCSKCKHCDDDPLSGVNPSNLRRHLKSAHIAIHDKVIGIVFSIMINCSNIELCVQHLRRHETRLGGHL